MGEMSRFAEILAIGLFAAAWVLLLGMRIILGRVPDGADIQELFSYLQGWEAAATVAGVLVLFQLGWMMNWVSYEVSKLIYNNRIKTRVFGPNWRETYNRDELNYLQNAKKGVLDSQRNDLVVLRLARASFVNFACIAALCFCFQWNRASGLAIAVSAFSLQQAWLRAGSYYKDRSLAFDAAGINRMTPGLSLPEDTTESDLDEA